MHQNFKTSNLQFSHYDTPLNICLVEATKVGTFF